MLDAERQKVVSNDKVFSAVGRSAVIKYHSLLTCNCPFASSSGPSWFMCMDALISELLDLANSNPNCTRNKTVQGTEYLDTTKGFMLSSWLDFPTRRIRYNSLDRALRSYQYESTAEFLKQKEESVALSP